MKVFTHEGEMALRVEKVDEPHKSKHHGRFAIARRSIEPNPEFRDLSGNGISYGIEVCFGRFVSLLVALVGGRWTNGLNCGLWCWNTNAASSNTNINYGARLLIIKFLTHHFP